MTKPTDGAVQLAEGVLCGIDDQFAPFASGAKHSPAQTQALATRIDKVAVAPAVRELVKALQKLNDFSYKMAEAQKIEVAFAMTDADRLLARYRHLIEESGE